MYVDDETTLSDPHQDVESLERTYLSIPGWPGALASVVCWALAQAMSAAANRLAHTASASAGAAARTVLVRSRTLSRSVSASVSQRIVQRIRALAWAVTTSEEQAAIFQVLDCKRQPAIGMPPLVAIRCKGL